MFCHQGRLDWNHCIQQGDLCSKVDRSYNVSRLNSIIIVTLIVQTVRLAIWIITFLFKPFRRLDFLIGCLTVFGCPHILYACLDMLPGCLYCLSRSQSVWLFRLSIWLSRLFMRVPLQSVKYLDGLSSCSDSMFNCLDYLSSCLDFRPGVMMCWQLFGLAHHLFSSLVFNPFTTALIIKNDPDSPLRLSQYLES